MHVKKLAALVAFVFAFVAFASPQAQAQQTVPAGEAQAFLGSWNLSIEGTPLGISIKDEGGQVAADVDLMGAVTKVTTISKDGETLNLRYVADLQGQQAPITIKLTPSGANLSAVIDVADGMFSANGTATKR
jgi:invasion protein IalB